MWISIWVCLVVFVFIFVGWTLLVLFQQKKAWEAFAKKNKLKYKSGTFMGSPEVSGDMNGYLFSLFSGSQQTEDVRGQRFVTIIEFQMGKGMPTGGVIATKEFSAFAEGLVFKQIYKPELAEWDGNYVVRARDKKNLDVYLSNERQKILYSIFKMKNASALFFFDEIEAVLRIETSDPLRNEAHLDKIIKQLLGAIDILVPTAKEKKEFKKLLAEEKKRQEDGFDEDEDEDEDEEEEEEEGDDALDGSEEEQDEPKKKPASKKLTIQDDEE